VPCLGPGDQSFNFNLEPSQVELDIRRLYGRFVIDLLLVGRKDACVRHLVELKVKFAVALDRVGLELTWHSRSVILLLQLLVSWSAVEAKMQQEKNEAQKSGSHGAFGVWKSRLIDLVLHLREASANGWAI
jgi:hypothetical protein